MKALAWHGKGDIRCDTVPDPKIQDGRDAIIKVTACVICGSDLHIFDGIIPSMESGDVLGHETMGEVVEVGSENKSLKVGDRVVVPFTISCGECFFCQRGYFSACERSNPDRDKAAKLWGNSPAGLFGYSHLLGGYAGGQAEYLRVPYADVGPLKVPSGLSDDQVLFLSDIFPTGYMAAEFCDIQPGDTIAVWGCGPVGQFAIRSAFLLGAERVIAIDRFPERLRMAQACGAIPLQYAEQGIHEPLLEMTGGRGPDARIDAVGGGARAPPSRCPRGPAAAAPTPASTRWAARRTPAASPASTTAPSRWRASRWTARTRCARRSAPAAAAARCRWSASTRDSSTSS